MRYVVNELTGAGAARCMKLPVCAGPGKGQTTWGLCTQPFPANFCKRLFPRLEPVTSWSQGGSFYHCAKAHDEELQRGSKNRKDVAKFILEK
jgi:hypothetical protein